MEVDMNTIANQKSKTVGEYVSENYRIAEVFENMASISVAVAKDL
jgi:hypothetical protein